MTIETHSGLLTAIKMTTAGAIAFIFSQLAPWPFSFWAVITVAAVTRPGLKNTYIKAAARFIGTFVGVILASLSLLIAKDNIYLLSGCFFIIIFFSSILSVQTSFISNCGLIIGITMVIVLAVGVSFPDPSSIIFLRIIDVLVGISAVLVVNIVLRLCFIKTASENKNVFSELDLRSYWIPPHLNTRSAYVIALTISSVTTLTFFVWLYCKNEGGYWATISCLVIMEDNLMKTKENMILRFVAHVFACIVGGISVLMIGQQSWLMGIPVLLTFFVCGYIMVKDSFPGKAANTIAVAVCIMLLIGPSERLIISTIIERFANTVIGIALGFLGTWLVLSNHSRAQTHH